MEGNDLKLCIRDRRFILYIKEFILYIKELFYIIQVLKTLQAVISKKKLQTSGAQIISGAVKAGNLKYPYANFS